MSDITEKTITQLKFVCAVEDLVREDWRLEINKLIINLVAVFGPALERIPPNLMFRNNV